MRISQKINPFGFDRYIVEKIFKRNNQIIEIKTYYFNQLDYFRKYIIKENNKIIREISCLYENKRPIYKNGINYLA